MKNEIKTEHKPLRILMINERYYDSGGAEKQFFLLKKELQKKGITVYSIGFGPKFDKGNNYCVLKESKFSFVREMYRHVLHPMKYLQMRRYIKNFNPDIIHLHNINNYTPSIIKAVKGYKIVVTLHDYSILCPENWNIHKNTKICETGFQKKCWMQHRKSSWPIFLSKIWTYFIKQRFFKTQVSVFIAPTPLLQRYVKNAGYKNVEYIADILNHDKAKNNLKNTYETILYVGSLEYNKGVTRLLEEYYLAKQKFPKLPKLVIVGKGTVYPELKTYVKNHGLNEDILFAGWSNDVTKYYKSAIFVVVPSLYMEQFGMVAAEAMNNSVAVVGSNGGGLSWLVKNNHTGVLFNPNTQSELSDIMIRLNKNKSLVRKMGADGFKRINNLIDNKKSIKDIINIYRTL